MSNLRMITDNLADSATLTASPAMAATLDVNNLKNDQRVEVARTTSTDDQAILLDLPSPDFFSAACLYGHNLSGAAQWRWRLYSSANQEGSLVFDSGLVRAVPIFTLGDYGPRWGVLPLGYSIFDGWDARFSTIWHPRVIAQSARLDIQDSGNSAGYLQARRLLAGDYVSYRYNCDANPTLTWVDTDEVRRTAGGSLDTKQGIQYRQLELTYSFLQHSERGDFLETMRRIRKSQSILMSLFPEQGGRLERDYTMLCKKTDGGAMTYAYPHHQTSLTLEEI